MGWRVRQCLLSKSERFRNPAMLSLTVDRKHFDSPEHAHQIITQGSYIARLMRLLDIRTWFWVLEFQTKTGDGWPHWHLLIDLADVGGRIDLPHAWRLWRDKWKLGGLDLSVRRSFADREHAVFYVTKYLTKMPEAFPLWVIRCEKAIRFIGGGKALGSLTGQPSRDSEQVEADPQGKLFKEPRTALLIRMARCEQTATVFCVDGDCSTGNGAWSWMGTIQARPDDLLELAEQGMLSLCMGVVDWGQSELLVITNASVREREGIKAGGVVAALRKLPGELEDRDVGYADTWALEVQKRETQLIEQCQAFWKARAA